MASVPRHRFEKLPDLEPELRDAQRRLYEAGEGSLVTAAKAFGRSASWVRGFALKQGWKKPAKKTSKPKPAAQLSAKPKPRLGKPTRPRRTSEQSQLCDSNEPPDSATIMKRLTWTALRLMNALERQLAEGDVSEPTTRMMANLIKMLPDFKKFDLENGETGLSGDQNEHAGATSAESAAEMARIRSEVVERLTSPDWTRGHSEPSEPA